MGNIKYNNNDKEKKNELKNCINNDKLWSVVSDEGIEEKLMALVNWWWMYVLWASRFFW